MKKNIYIIIYIWIFLRNDKKIDVKRGKTGRVWGSLCLFSVFVPLLHWSPFIFFNWTRITTFQKLPSPESSRVRDRQMGNGPTLVIPIKKRVLSRGASEWVSGLGSC